MKRLAVITMVFNESFNLPYWLNYYSRQVDDLSDIYILDHGSNDCSTGFLDKRINLIRLPRNAYSNDMERGRSEEISRLARQLMSVYRSVIYVDCDEFLVADPRLANSLASFSENSGHTGVISAIGFNLLHDYKKEKDLKYGDLISKNRSKLFLTSSMFKASLSISTRSIHWHDGFHFSNQPPQFTDLYLFHTKFIDLKQGLKRLELTRNLKDQPRLNQAVHQRVSDEQYQYWIDQMLECPHNEEDIGLLNKEIREFIESLEITKPDVFWHFPLNQTTGKVYELPERFKGLF